MVRSFAILITVLVLLAAALSSCGGEHEEEGEGEKVKPAVVHVFQNAHGETVVTLGTDLQRQIGVVTAPLATSTRFSQRVAYGAILDPAPLAALQSQRTSADAAMQASRAEFLRSKSLYKGEQNVSLQQVQAAEAKFLADQSQAELLRQQMANDWGEPIAGLNSRERTNLVQELVRRTTALARVNLPPGEAFAGAPIKAVATILGYDSTALEAVFIFPAPSADPQMRGPGFLLRLNAQGIALRPGQALSARLFEPGPPRAGFVIPNSAIVRLDGKGWAYVKIDASEFVRRVVPLEERGADGWFTQSGFSPGEQVAIAGAESLLSSESQPQSGSADSGSNR